MFRIWLSINLSYNEEFEFKSLDDEYRFKLQSTLDHSIGNLLTNFKSASYISRNLIKDFNDKINGSKFSYSELLRGSH